jgi:light-regulated signal transduction histidine kinase (bacteriophytochrome)
MQFSGTVSRFFTATGFSFISTLLLSLAVVLGIAILVTVFRLRREIRQRRQAQLQAQENVKKSADLHSIVLNDIAQRKIAEDRIDNLTAALQKRTEQLALANKELESFSYSVSHDLRAPLRVIGGYAMMLEEDCAAVLDEEGKRYLHVIRANTRKMDTLIVDLLKLAKSTLAPLTIDNIDMQQMALKTIKDMGIENSDSNAAVTIDNLHPADANASLIQQVWENLLTNAAKFSSKNASPAIRVSSEQSPAETVYCVEDNGVGFDIQKAVKLFEVFQRFHSQEAFPGTGVGLALVKRIVTRHGGRIWAQSEPGAGAKFYFALPNPQSEAGYTADYNHNQQNPS